MVAATPGTTSIIELGATQLGALMARRRARREGRGGIFHFVGEVLGTVLALACLVVSAFVVGFAVGMAAAGVALLLLDFKVAVVRRARATAHSTPRAGGR